MISGGMRMIGNSMSLRGVPIKGSPASAVVFFEPGVMAKSKAKVFEIRADERLTDADIVVDLNGLHSVRGRVLANEDRHVPSKAAVQLGDDAEKGVGRGTQISADGTFHIDYVPAGTYTLSVIGWDMESTAGKLADGPDEVIRRSYAATKMPIVVAEHDVVIDDIQLIESKDKGVPK